MSEIELLQKQSKITEKILKEYIYNNITIPKFALNSINRFNNLEIKKHSDTALKLAELPGMAENDLFRKALQIVIKEKIPCDKNCLPKGLLLELTEDYANIQKGSIVLSIGHNDISYPLFYEGSESELLVSDEKLFIDGPYKTPCLNKVKYFLYFIENCKEILELWEDENWISIMDNVEWYHG